MSTLQSQLRKAFDVQSEKFRPLWIRGLIVAVAAGWTAVEVFISQSAFWGILAAATTAYLFHQFFIAFAPPSDIEK